MSEYQNPIDALYDENNNDIIQLYAEDGKLINFEQIAVIPLNDLVYAILKPVQPLEGVGEDEGLVFEIETNEDGAEYLKLVVDMSIIDAVFDIYDELVEAEEEE